MHPIYFMFLIFTFLVIWIGVFQMIVPLAKGQKMFPIFKPSQKMEGDLADAKEKVAEQNMRQEIKSWKDQINKEE